MVGEKVKFVFVILYLVIPLYFCLNITLSLMNEKYKEDEVYCDENSGSKKINFYANFTLVIVLSFIYNTKKVLKTGVL